MSGLILGLRPANQRRRYFVTMALIGPECSVCNWLTRQETIGNMYKPLVINSTKYFQNYTN